LRAALKSAMSDPAMIEDARKQNFELRYVPGEAVERLIKRVYATPASIVEAAIAATKPAGAR
jgi:hypothetical protein